MSNYHYTLTERDIARLHAEAMRTAVVEQAYDQAALARVCEMHETSFGDFYQMDTYEIASVKTDENYYYFLDRGADILAVAHLDTVVDHEKRTASFCDTEAGPVIFSGALDDRLGAYIILELLPKLGINVDILLTVGEESGKSTAEHFDPPKGKDYLWGIEFDRGGTDVVMYQYDDFDTRSLVKDCGASVGNGSFSDIAYLEHMEVKMFNWGVGYKDYHSVRGHAFLDDTFMMVAQFMAFHEVNSEVYLPHDYRPFASRQGRRIMGLGSGYGGGLWDSSDRYDQWWEQHKALNPPDRSDGPSEAEDAAVDAAARAEEESYQGEINLDLGRLHASYEDSLNDDTGEILSIIDAVIDDPTPAQLAELEHAIAMDHPFLSPGDATRWWGD